MSLIAGAPSPHLSLSIHSQMDHHLPRVPNTPKTPKDTLEGNTQLIFKALIHELQAMGEATNKMHEIEAEHKKCCLWRGGNKCVIIVVSTLIITGFAGDSVASALSYSAERNNTALAYLITAIAGGILSTAGSIIVDMYSNIKELFNNAQEQIHTQQAHTTHVHGLLVALDNFLHAKQEEKMEAFRKCLIHLKELPACGGAIDSNTREELITSMLKFLREDNPLITELKKITALAQTLSTDHPAEHKGETKSPKHPQQQQKDSFQTTTEAVPKNVVVFHGSAEDMGVLPNNPFRLPVGSGRNSPILLTSEIEQETSGSRPSLIRDLLKLLYDLKLKYIRLLGRMIEFPERILGPYISSDSVRIDIIKSGN